MTHALALYCYMLLIIAVWGTVALMALYAVAHAGV